MTQTTFSFCQRWRKRRDSYRPAGEPIDTTKYGVEVIEEKAAKAFVIGHHYSASYPASRFRAGLFRTTRANVSELVGTAVFSVPMQRRVIPCYAPGTLPNDGIELGRFVLLDDVPANGESWFLARAFKLLKQELDLKVVVAYSDPTPRTTSTGYEIKPGHVGTIYQAYNGKYLGRANGEKLTLAADGTVISRRSLSKIKNEERSAGYAYRKLIEKGAPKRQPLEDSRAYVERVLSSGVFRQVKHPGNHVYAWPLVKKVEMRSSHPYPKQHQQAS